MKLRYLSLRLEGDLKRVGLQIINKFAENLYINSELNESSLHNIYYTTQRDAVKMQESEFRSDSCKK
jgi:hypothetical protein